MQYDVSRYNIGKIQPGHLHFYMIICTCLAREGS